jgi:uncharacterized Fe-S center protein
MSELLFADYVPKNLEPINSIGAKWLRLLAAMPLESVAGGKRVCVKMHLGGGTGFTTIHPFFTRKLIDRIKAAGASAVFIADSPGSVATAAERGYTAETVGCPLVSISGPDDRHVRLMPIQPPFGAFNEVEIGAEILDAEALIDFSHIKGHGACGFGGASKNLSMGCVSQRSRGSIHALEGGLDWDRAKCSHCKVCAENCENGAISFTEDGQFDVFYHNCKFCQHCVLICPEHAIRMLGGRYRDFQRGMALTTQAVLAGFKPENRYFINLLMNITIFCDCWGMTTPNLVPDIGILAGSDIVAIEQASLDLIREEKLIPGSLPAGWALGASGHLFEKIHGKDPYAVIAFLHELGLGERDYTVHTLD